MVPNPKALYNVDDFVDFHVIKLWELTLKKMVRLIHGISQKHMVTTWDLYDI